MASNILSKFSHYWVLAVIIALSALAAIIYAVVYVTPVPQGVTGHDHTDESTSSSSNAATPESSYHTVTATLFWVGEVADESNAYIPNDESAWVGDWVAEFGGIDSPDNRCGYNPCAFTPKQNAFYIALPFNDIDAKGGSKAEDVLKKIPWYTGMTTPGVSLMKNHWVQVKYGDKIAYGQIEDVGPMYEDDVNYVFGAAEPKYAAGIDLSPALTDFLGTKGLATVQWRFVDESAVTSGPWLDNVTRSQINY